MWAADEVSEAGEAGGEEVLPLSVLLSRLVAAGRLTDSEAAALSGRAEADLETQRAGWAAKTDLALREVERQRRAALAVHETVTLIGRRAAGALAGIWREPSVYAGCEHDEKVRELATLDEDVRGVVAATVALRADRCRCLALLQLDRDAVDSLSDVIERHVRAWSAELARVSASEREFAREVTALAESLEAQRGAAAREAAARALMERELRAAVSSALPEVTHRAVQATGPSPNTRDCCIQVGTAAAATATVTPSPTDVMPLPVTMVTVSKTRHAPTADGHNKCDVSGAPKQTDAVDFLRRQVEHFAEKLERSRWQMEVYQRQLAWMRMAPHTQRHLADTETGKRRYAATDMAAWRGPEAAYLGGSNRMALPPLDTGGATDSDARGSRHRAPLVRRCGRCGKLFKASENHKLCCRYHPKGQQKVEKYDGRGRLLRVTHIWQCCMQRAEAPGCSVDEHT